MSDLIRREDALAVLCFSEETKMMLCKDLRKILEKINDIPSAEPERKTGKCTKINCPIQINYISNDCDIKTCPYRTERKIGKWKNVALFTRECSECGAQFHELEYDNFCPNCGVKMEWNE